MTLALPLAEAGKHPKKKAAKKKSHSSVSSIKRERSSKEDELTRLKREIADYQRQLKDHEAKATRSKRNLSAYNARTVSLQSMIARLEDRVDELGEKKEIVEDSLRQNRSTLDHLQSAYASGARFLYMSGALERTPVDEHLIVPLQTGEDQERQAYYAGVVARAHAMNRERLDSARTALGVTKQGITNDLLSSARAIDQRSIEEQQVESRKNEEAKRLAQIEQDRERLQKILLQKQASAKRLERMIADLIVKEEKAAEARREALKRAKKNEKRTGKSPSHNEKSPAFADDLAEPGHAYGPHSLAWPTSSHQIRQAYGEHRNAELNTVTMNLGIDIAATEGSPVRASADGVVALVSSLPSYGTIVVLQHAGGLHTVYADLANVSVHAGSRVTAGQVIARSGANEELGSVLHFEVWKGKAHQNPVGWLR